MDNPPPVYELLLTTKNIFMNTFSQGDFNYI